MIKGTDNVTSLINQVRRGQIEIDELPLGYREQVADAVAQIEKEEEEARLKAEAAVKKKAAAAKKKAPAKAKAASKAKKK